MKKNIYLARQPIIDLKANICAYEILFRDMNQKSVIKEHSYASASVINSVLNKFGTKELLEDKRGFVKIDEKFLLNDIIFYIPKEFFIFALFEDIPMSENVILRIEELQKAGYLIGLNDTKLTPDTFDKYAKILQYLSFFKLDFTRGLDVDIPLYIQKLKKYDIKVIATKVEDYESYEIAKKIGADCFQGYFFAKPKILQNNKFEAAPFDVLKLYNLLMQDASINEITAAFEKSPEITIQLLQFLNSGAFHFPKRIASIRQVITLMGRETLGKWLMLMIYSKSLSKNENSKPLMLMVQNRIQLMELLLREVEPNVTSERVGEAYFVAVLSLIETVFSMRLEDVLQRVNISESVKEALLDYKNIFGEILQVILCIEKSNLPCITQFERDNSLEPGTVQKVVLRAIENVNREMV
ncbi:EAL domain protein [hydrothermal vent metagenome]|uniref:EAL domain protein n=1 Tax=hydrothermal vent metagenome TaxID=652676 RepID=A0A1W1BP46_9ZZZZ